jgi:ParB-like nuclease domain
MRVLRSRRKPELLELSEVEQRLRPLRRTYLGARLVPLAHIVGTEGRAGAFTRDFEPRHSFSRERLRSLETAFPDGGFPPIVAVKFGETYFVIDGHHRVALARRNGADSIEAVVTEFVSRVPLPPGADMVEVILRELERVFLEESGLAKARRGVRVAASRPYRYLELLENLQVHGYHLMREQDRVLTDKEIAADWYDRVFSPVVVAVERERLGKDYRDAPDADLFLLLHRRRREAFPSCGCPPLEETLADVAAEATTKRRLPLRRRR